jgi:hypothetical protein
VPLDGILAVTGTVLMKLEVLVYRWNKVAEYRATVCIKFEKSERMCGVCGIVVEVGIRADRGHVFCTWISSLTRLK